MRRGRIHAFYQSQLTEMPDRWKKVWAIIKPTIFFDSHEIILIILKIKCVQASRNFFSTIKIKDNKEERYSRVPRLSDTRYSAK